MLGIVCWSQGHSRINQLQNMTSNLISHETWSKLGKSTNQNRTHKVDYMYSLILSRCVIKILETLILENKTLKQNNPSYSRCSIHFIVFTINCQKKRQKYFQRKFNSAGFRIVSLIDWHFAFLFLSFFL